MCYTSYMKYHVVLLFIFLSLFGCKTTPKKFSEISATKSDKTFKRSIDSDLKKIEEADKSSLKIVEIAYEILAQGNNFKEGLSSIIRLQEDLDKLYSILYADSVKAPVIDFSKKAVVIVEAGPFSTGGYSIIPVSATKSGKIIKFVFEVSAPGPMDIVTQAFTHPYLIVAVDADPYDDIFIEVKGNNKKKKYKSNF
ncbi:dentilisin complex subunit PrcB [Treponema sp. OMZ 792]|nr:dentilisin complex subunit PrcB [Treponema sp. OMZ 792]UTC79321.1 dentilisin complex subunit PrcB [Treponema sp. OMZ 798]